MIGYFTLKCQNTLFEDKNTEKINGKAGSPHKAEKEKNKLLGIPLLYEIILDHVPMNRNLSEKAIEILSLDKKTIEMSQTCCS